MILNLISILFLILVCLGFAIIPGRFRPALLLGAGSIYVFSLSIWAGTVLLAVSLIVYVVGIFIGNLLAKDREITAKMLLIFSVILIAAAMLLQKVPSFVAFVGFSFYGFSAIGYLTDIYQKKINADKNLIRTILFLSYFPRFISGPIERKNIFDEQLENSKRIKFFKSNRLLKAFIFILVGAFMKVVIADRLNIFSDEIFNCYDVYDSLGLIFGSLLYTLQIYADFAGYSYMAFGISLLFGIEINMNFRSPYLASNISEFWRRWHISLSNFLRDYVYIPLGGSRKGLLRKNINVFVVFIVCGIWHGYGISFLIWGGLHGLYSIMDNFLRAKNMHRLRTGSVGRIITFCGVSFAWIFFRAPSTREALGYLKTMFSAGIDPGAFYSRFLAERRNLTEIVLIVLLVMALCILERKAFKKDYVLPEYFLEKKLIYKCVLFYILLLLIAVIGIYGPDFNSADFIYMQF